MPVMKKTTAQYEAMIATLEKVNARLNNEVHEAQAQILKFDQGEIVEDLNGELKTAHEVINSLRAQLATIDAEGAADVVEALKEWFERKDISFAAMDAETAQLCRVLGHERYYV